MHARACVRARACLYARAFLRECVRDVFAIYDNNISPRLIIIIITISAVSKNSILRLCLVK